jgi:transcriptional regulator with XRE-family HTH domain
MVMDFANRFKAQRVSSGLSQATVAKRLGITPSMVSQIETGHREPQWTLLVQYAVDLSWPIEPLVGPDLAAKLRKLLKAPKPAP